MSDQKTLRPCKVILAGGGIAGLALALMLEKNNIDYVLLEAYPELVPKLSAGIILVPNGLRIIDQIGCFEGLMASIQDIVNTMTWRDEKGEVVAKFDPEKRSIELHGYPVIWVDRKDLLQVLYDHIVDKSKLLTNKRVSTVRHLDGSVEVDTEDGSTYQGDIVVGVDGVHSRVRQEMNRHAAEKGVGADYDDLEEVPATYVGMFGVSPIIPGFPKGYLGFGIAKHYAYILGTGQGEQTYWLITENLGKTFHGPEVLEAAQRSKEEFAKRHLDDIVYPGITFSKLWETRTRVLYTPLREHPHQKWQLDRIICIGDASHKMTPVTGQGGNLALEDAATLTNSLVKALSKPTTDRLSLEEIQTALREVEQARLPRINNMLEVCHARQTLDCMETPEIEAFARTKFGATMPAAVEQRWEATYFPAASLNMLPLPSRPKKTVWDDERANAAQAVEA